MRALGGFFGSDTFELKTKSHFFKYGLFANLIIRILEQRTHMTCDFADFFGLS